ncbi:MAG: VWA domain-containing protein [Planctomycetes bacterium]|nr:VWA domain-containing protein [Planctomycetota bacterium]
MIAKTAGIPIFDANNRSALEGILPQAGFRQEGSSVPTPGEELWVIQKAEPEMLAHSDDSIPKCGQLLTEVEDTQVPVPLKHTDVHASIAGYIATVDVTQQYHNPFEEKIEAVYVFPLPDNAAVNEFLMTIGERKIRGIIREREEAEKIYAQARSQGYVASLLTQERPNVFTQSVANIEPGKDIDINIKYYSTLSYDDGWYEFVFPMVVGPRFNPPGSTDGIGAVGRGRYGASGQSTEVEYLKPGERSGHDIGLELEIEAGVKIERVRSVNHQIAVNHVTESNAIVKLDELDSIPNKDFVLRYQVAGDRIKTAVMTQPGPDGKPGYFTMMVYPPNDLTNLQRGPMEMIFVIDCSGSMSGKPIEQAKAAVLHALDKMRPEDTFQIIRFSNSASKLGPDPIPATEANIARGKKYVKSLNGNGGTMMIEGIKAALNARHDEEHARTVAFLTDGYIGNEAQILTEVMARLGDSRIFSFGVGSSTNRYLLNSLALVGRGAVAYLSLNDDAGDVMDRYFDRVSHAAMKDVAIDWGSLKVTDVYPQRLPDLVIGRPIILTGRYEGTADSSTVRVHGTAGGSPSSINIAFDPTGRMTKQHAGLPAVWARYKLADLARSNMADPDGEWDVAMLNLALEYGLMSQYTAFVAVDSSRVTEGDHGTTIGVPVPVPDGVKYETTVSER